jgi:hypothetical protein
MRNEFQVNLQLNRHYDSQIAKSSFHRDDGIEWIGCNDEGWGFGSCHSFGVLWVCAAMACAKCAGRVEAQSS